MDRRARREHARATPRGCGSARAKRGDFTVCRASRVRRDAFYRCARNADSALARAGHVPQTRTPCLPGATASPFAVNRARHPPVAGSPRRTMAVPTPHRRRHEPDSAASPACRHAPLRCARRAALPAAAQPIRLGELNSYKVFPAFLEPYKKGMELARRRDQRRRRRARPAARDRVARRQRQSRRCGPRRRGAALARKGRAADGDVRVQRRARGRRSREAAQGAVPRRRAAHRQDRLGERQPVHVPAARVDLHADGDARARGGEARQEALGDRLSQLRVRPIGHRRVQAADDRAAGGRHRVRRAGGAARQDRRRARRAGDARREAGRDLLVAVRRRTSRASSARASCAASSRAARCSTCWAASPSTSIR